MNTSGTNCWGEQYGYDTWGNLKTIGFPSQYNSSCAQPDNLNVGVSTTTNQINSPSGYVYDLAGNLTTIPSGGGSYSYDAENRMTSTAGVNYTYDGDGKRIEKSNGTLYWYGMSSDVLEETSLSGALTNDYVFLGGQRVARRDASGNIFGYFADHLGSSRKVEEIASGGSTASLSYDADFYPFGRAHEFTNTSDPIHKFTGKQRDIESGLDNFGARYSSSTIARFMSPDLVGGHTEDPQTLNRYSYVRNNPLSLTDPTGLDFYLTCTHTDQNTSTCQQQTVGYDSNGKAQTAWVQGVTTNGQFTATQIGNDAYGNLVDKTTGTGMYSASVNGGGVQLSTNGGDSFSTGVFVNPDANPTSTVTQFQDAGWANGSNLSGFNFTFTNSKLEANQTAAGTFTFSGNVGAAEAALKAVGFQYHAFGQDAGYDEFRSGGAFVTGANSGHVNVNTNYFGLDPVTGVPLTFGNMHFGEHNPFSTIGWLLHCVGDQACR